MSISITVTPTSPVAVTSAARIDIAGASANTLVGYDPAKYPSSPEIRCYLAFLKGSTELGRSYVFAVGEDGKHVFNNYIFPSSGSWTVKLFNADGDVELASQGVTVS
jgi:hypothetical protein